MINHLTQPASFGLYTKAIVESGAYGLGAGTMAGAEASYQALLSGTYSANMSQHKRPRLPLKIDLVCTL